MECGVCEVSIEIVFGVGMMKSDSSKSISIFL